MEIPPIQYTTTSDGVRIAYQRFPGAPPPFLFVNTPASPPLSLRPTAPGLVEGLRDHFARGRAFAWFDWRGKGDSERCGPDAITMDGMVADIDAVAGALGEPVDAKVAGDACFAACLHAARCPNRYRSIEFRDGAVRVEDSWQGMMNRQGWEANYRDLLVGHMRTWFDVSPAEALALVARMELGMSQPVFAAYCDVVRNRDLTDVLRRISIPVLVAADQVANYEPAAVMAALFPDARLVVLPPSLLTAERHHRNREIWDEHLGTRLGDARSRPASSVGEGQLLNLTPREHQVLALLVDGRTNAEIAEALTLSTRTIEFHIGNIYSKLGVHNRVAAVNAARAAGLVSRSESDHFT